MKNATQLNVERMIVEGVSTSEIEDFIERQPIGDEEKAALALLTWACIALNVDPTQIGPVVIADAAFAAKSTPSDRASQGHHARVGRLIADIDAG